MNTSQNAKKVQFRHVVLKGSAYQIGRQEAEFIKSDPAAVGYFTSGMKMPIRTDMKTVMEPFRRYCPSVLDEIAGFAEGLHATQESIVYLAATWLQRPGCSHLAVLPRMTASGHTLVARSYDFSENMDDLSLVSTSVDGKYAHIGFSTMLFGRCDGMNEHGLSVTMSAGGIPVGNAPGQPAPIRNGLQFWVLVRALLEECRTVDEAEQVIRDFPTGGNPILIVADPSGKAIAAECYGAERGGRRIDSASSMPYLWAANHFIEQEMQIHSSPRMANSIRRGEIMDEFLQKMGGKVTKENLKGLLSKPYPDGLCCHYYPDFFGTLHSLVFDLDERTAEISFGSPAVNEWRTFTLSDQKPGEYEVLLPQEKAEPDFMRMD
jgi:predicted choloylglycine hydrolase